MTSIAMVMNQRIRILCVATALAATPAAASVYGPLENFDVVNDTGQDTCGFEIEIEGVHGAEIYRTFASPYIRYGTPTLIDTATGVLVRYQSLWSAATHTFLQVTPPAQAGYVPASDSCWTIGLGAGYAGSGCEHFGVSQTTQATSTRYRWLACHPADGTVTPLPDLPLPSPAWSSTPPANPGNPEVVRAEIEIPNPEGDAYGDAYWVKVFKTEAPHPIELDDLMLDNALIAGAEVEIEWELLQAKPGHDVVFNEAPLGDGAEAVVRRYEFYRYNTSWGLANTYDDPNTGLPVSYVNPENGEVEECVVNGCNDPTPDELGPFIGRQMAGFNLAPTTACSNGIDDDGDGLVDLGDSGCAGADADTENPACNDGIDNDGDSLVDVADPGCTGAASNIDENPPLACGLLGIEPIAALGLFAALRSRALTGCRRRPASGAEAA